MLHKEDLKEFSGDKKLYCGWTTNVQTFCNTKRPGFRKALLWAAKMTEPIAAADLGGTQWEAIAAANTKMYDLLIQICIC